MSNFDEQLIARVGQGDGEAFRQLYLASSDAVYGYALSILRNHADAEDVMHDTFIKVHRSAAGYRAQGKPMAWVLTIVKNLCRNKLAAGKRAVDLEAEPDVATLPAGQQHVLDRMVLQTALDVLDQTDRQIVVLHAAAGLKHREIAELVEMPEGTVLSKYHRALEKLRSALGEEEEAR